MSLDGTGWLHRAERSARRYLLFPEANARCERSHGVHPSHTLSLFRVLADARKIRTCRSATCRPFLLSPSSYTTRSAINRSCFLLNGGFLPVKTRDTCIPRVSAGHVQRERCCRSSASALVRCNNTEYVDSCRGHWFRAINSSHSVHRREP